jgi:hypothetical protein
MAIEQRAIQSTFTCLSKIATRTALVSDDIEPLMRYVRGEESRIKSEVKGSRKQLGPLEQREHDLEVARNELMTEIVVNENEAAENGISTTTGNNVYTRTIRTLRKQVENVETSILAVRADRRAIETKNKVYSSTNTVVNAGNLLIEAIMNASILVADDISAKSLHNICITIVEFAIIAFKPAIPTLPDVVGQIEFGGVMIGVALDIVTAPEVQKYESYLVEPPIGKTTEIKVYNKVTEELRSLAGNPDNVPLLKDIFWQACSEQYNWEVTAPIHYPGEERRPTQFALDERKARNANFLSLSSSRLRYMDTAYYEGMQKLINVAAEFETANSESLVQGLKKMGSTYTIPEIAYRHSMNFFISVTTKTRGLGAIYTRYIVHDNITTLQHFMDVVEHNTDEGLLSGRNFTVNRSVNNASGMRSAIVTWTTVINGYHYNNINPCSMYELYNNMRFAMNQLQASTPEGLKKLKKTSINIRSDMKDYGTSLDEGSIDFMNPFYFKIDYALRFEARGRKLPGCAHKDFIEYSSKRSKDGFCLIAALRHMDPKPIESIINNIVDVMSIPVIVIKSMNKVARTWVLGHVNREELRNIEPSVVDFKKVCVLYEHAKHWYRVHRILPIDNAMEASSTIRVGNTIWSCSDGDGSFKSILAECNVNRQLIEKIPEREPMKKLRHMLHDKYEMLLITGKQEPTEEEMQGDNLFRRAYSLPIIILVEPNAIGWNVLDCSDSNGKPLTEEERKEIIKECTIKGLTENKIKDELLARSKLAILGTYAKFSQADIEKYSSDETYQRLVVVCKRYERYFKLTLVESEDTRQVGQYIVKLHRSQEDLMMANGFSSLEELRVSETGYVILAPSGLTSIDVIEPSAPVEWFNYEDTDFESHLVLWKSGEQWGHIIGINEESGNVRTKISKKEKTYINLAYDCETINVKRDGRDYEETVPTLWSLYGFDDALKVCEAEKQLRTSTWKKEKDGFSITFKGNTCSKDLIDWLYTLSTTKATNGAYINVWGFNSARFDVYHVLSPMCENELFQVGRRTDGTVGKTLESNAEIIKVGNKILKFTADKVTFKDIKNFSGFGSLASTSNNWKLPSLKGEWNHEATQKIAESCTSIDEFIGKLEKMQASKLMVEPKLNKKEMDGVQLYESRLQEYQERYYTSAMNAYQEYCINDSRVTLMLTKAFMVSTSNATDNNFDMNTSMTLPQAAYKYLTHVMKQSKKSFYHAKNEENISLIEIEKLLKSATLAGRSQRFNWVNPGVNEKALMLYVDCVSQYPHVMMECPFPAAGKAKKVTNFVRGKLGFYRIRIKKQSFPVIFPFKAEDKASDCLNESGSHQWEYKGEFETTVASVLLLDFWNFGGECEILWGLVFENHRFGLLTDALKVFKDIKQQQDLYKVSKTEKDKYNPSLREAVKLILNAISGKLIQKMVHKKMYLLNDLDLADEQAEAMQRPVLEGGMGLKNVSIMEMRNEAPLELKLKGEGNVKLVVGQEDLDTLLEDMKKAPIPRAVGLFVYAWSQHHFLHAVLARAEKAHATYAVETDSIQMNAEKYETWCLANGVKNPYDVPATIPEYTEEQYAKNDSRVTPMADPIFDFSRDETINGSIHIAAKERNEALGISGKRLGYFYVPKAAAVFDATYKARRPLDFGDFDVESGIRAGKMYRTDCIYIGKKSYWIEDMAKINGPKQVFKGLGPNCKLQSMVEHTEGGITTHDWSVLGIFSDDTCGRWFYERLASGQAVRVAEQRFRGTLAFKTNDDSIHYRHEIVTKLVKPDDRLNILVRGLLQTSLEKQWLPGYPKADRDDLDPTLLAPITFLGQVITHAEWCNVMQQIASMKGNFTEGLTVDVNGQKGYLTPKTLQFICSPRQWASMWNANKL